MHEASSISYGMMKEKGDGQVLKISLCYLVIGRECHHVGDGGINESY